MDYPFYGNLPVLGPRDFKSWHISFHTLLKSIETTCYLHKKEEKAYSNILIPNANFTAVIKG